MSFIYDELSSGVTSKYFLMSIFAKKNAMDERANECARADNMLLEPRICIAPGHAERNIVISRDTMILAI